MPSPLASRAAVRRTVSPDRTTFGWPTRACSEVAVNRFTHGTGPGESVTLPTNHELQGNCEPITPLEGTGKSFSSAQVIVD